MPSGRPDPLASLDLAYLVEAFRGTGPALKAIAGSIDGYALITRSLAARPDDPALEFAAALIAADKHRAACERHARKARAGAARDQLLARNLDKVSKLPEGVPPRRRWPPSLTPTRRACLTFSRRPPGVLGS